MKYEVNLTVMISPKADEGAYSTNYLTFHRQLLFEGSRFSDIASRVDALYDAIEHGLQAGDGPEPRPDTRPGTSLFMTGQARQVLVRAAGQTGHVEVKTRIPAEEGKPGHAGTFVELFWEVLPGGSLLVRPWIDGIPADMEVPGGPV